MKSLMDRAPVCLYVLVLVLSSCVGLRAQSEDRGSRPLQMASLHSGLVWQRTSPTIQKPEGPVLYQILFRSSAKPGFVPKIDGSFTLTNSLVSEDNAGIHIGGLAIAPTGAITLCCGQSFGAGGAGGTVTNIATGAGLTGGPISTSGTISIANGGVTTAQIGSGAATNGQVLTANGNGDAAWQNLSVGSLAWALSGNAGTGCTMSPCTDFLGTTDNSALEIRVGGNRAFRIEPVTDGQIGFGFAPNVIGGFSGNTITGIGTAGATIAGGGAKGIGNENLINTVSGTFGTVGGGYFNTASGIASTAAGGAGNTASGGHPFSTVGGGSGTWSSGLDSSGAAGSAHPQGGGVGEGEVKGNVAGMEGKQGRAQGRAMRVTTGNYKQQAASIRHIGPMAQDFRAAFQVGEDDKHITEIDEGGVAFAAIQGLNQKLENNVEQLHAQLKNKDAQIAAQQKHIEALDQQVRAMMTRVEAVEKTSRKNARARRKLRPFGNAIGL